MRQCVVYALKHIAKISNSNRIKNTDGQIARMDKDPEVMWVDKNKTGVDISKFKTTY